MGRADQSRPVGNGAIDKSRLPNPTSLDETVRAGDYLPDAAVDHTSGTIYMTFADHVGNGFNHVKITKSTDGGKRWSTPTVVGETPSTTHSFNGMVEVAADGTVVVLYYDFRNNTPSPGLDTDVWLAHSHDGGSTWTSSTFTAHSTWKRLPSLAVGSLATIKALPLQATTLSSTSQSRRGPKTVLTSWPYERRGRDVRVLKGAPG